MNITKSPLECVVAFHNKNNISITKITIGNTFRPKFIPIGYLIKKTCGFGVYNKSNHFVDAVKEIKDGVNSLKCNSFTEVNDSSSEFSNWIFNQTPQYYLQDRIQSFNDISKDFNKFKVNDYLKLIKK